MKFLFAFILLSTFAIAEDETEFDKFVEKQKKENLPPGTREKLEKKHEFIHPALKPKKNQGLIDPLIDKAKETSEEGKKKIEEVTGKIERSEDLRDHSFGSLMLGYQAFTTWIPGKWTGSYTQIFNRKWSLEGEYSRATLSVPVLNVDIGKIREERVTLQARYYPGNSFNWTFGMMYQHGEANLGADIPATTNVDVFRMENFGATAGFGNRWQWKNGVTFGVDWFRMNQPLFGRWEDKGVLKTVSKKDADDLKKIMRAFNTFPTFVFFGLSVGYTF